MGRPVYSLVAGTGLDHAELDLRGAAPDNAGTIYTTLGALLIAVPLGLGCAIFLVEFCPSWLRSPLTATVRLLAAIPSVIYGLVGLIVVVPLIAHTLITNKMAMSMISVAALDGSSILAGMIVLSIMICPIFIALSSDALRAVPRAYREAAFSLGISHWRTIIKVMLPVARQGIIAGGDPGYGAGDRRGDRPFHGLRRRGQPARFAVWAGLLSGAGANLSLDDREQC